MGFERRYMKDLQPIDFTMCELSTQLGRVRFNDETSAIYINVHPGYEYDVTLKRCRTAGACLDWIHQISDKTWGREVIADFTKILFSAIPSTLWSGK